MGGNHIRAVISDLCGQAVARVAGPGPLTSGRAEILDSLEASLDQALVQAGLARPDLRGVGISLYGSVDPSAGVVYSWTETPGVYNLWKDFPVRAEFLRRLPLPHIYVDDVVRTLGVAEVLYGLARGLSEDFAYVLADTGIGAALVLAGQPYVGPSQLSGELGHLPIAREPIPCSCGNLACLETVASVHGVLRAVRLRLEEPPISSSLAALEREVAIQDVILAAEAGDKLAYRILTEAGEALGRGIAMLVNLFGCRKIVLGGVLASSSVYLDAAARAARLNALAKAAQVLSFERSELDQFAAARGAASSVLNALFEPGPDNLLASPAPL